MTSNKHDISIRAVSCTLWRSSPYFATQRAANEEGGETLTAETQTLAIHGGAKVRTEPMKTRLGRRFDEQKLEELKEALDRQALFYWFGEKVRTLCRQFAAMCGMKHCHVLTSGTAALRVANAEAGIGPGDEVIALPMTDQGSVILRVNATRGGDLRALV